MPINIYILILISSAFIACNTDNEVSPLFDDVVNNRINSQLASYKKLLTDAEFGWKSEYRAENNGGAYSIYLKFDNNNNIQIISDYDNGNNDLPTTYRVGISQFPELVFENYTMFHSLYVARGFELNAEFEFIFEEVTSDYIILKSKTDVGEKSTVTLVKATAEDKNKITQLQGLDARIKTGFINNSVFRNLTVKNTMGDIIFSSAFSYNDLTRLSTIFYIENEIEIIKEYPIISTITGFDFIDPIFISETEFKSFTYDAINDLFTSTVGNLTATIAYSHIPEFIKNDSSVFTSVGYKTFAYGSIWGTNHLTSTGFENLISQINTNLISENKSLYKFELFLENINTTGMGSSETPITLWVNMQGSTSDDNHWAGYKFDAKIVDSILFLNYSGTENDDGIYYKTKLQPLLDFFASTKGLYYENFGLYNSSTAFDWYNNSGTFTSLQDTSLRIYSLWYPQ
jgi:hypothetical protein